jgi:probable phosphoglycerate mutase
MDGRSSDGTVARDGSTEGTAAGRCFLLRHGATAWAIAGRHTGRTDVSLEPVGVLQAREAGKSLAGDVFALVLVSPLQRAMETCRLAGFGNQAVSTDDLLEWDYGGYEGMTTKEIRDDRPGWSLWDDGVPPGPTPGESIAEVAARVDRVVARARATDDDVLCVAHGHVLRVLAARWLGLAPEEGRHFAMEPASISLLGWEREEPVILGWNRTGPAVHATVRAD